MPVVVNLRRKSQKGGRSSFLGEKELSPLFCPGDPDDSVAKTTVEALGGLQGPLRPDVTNVVGLSAVLLKSESGRSRLNAARTLGNVGGTGAVEGLTDDDTAVLEEVARARRW